MPGLMDFFTGSKSKMKSYNKQGLNALQQLIQGGGLEQDPLYGSGSNYLQNLLSGSPEAFKSFEAPYMQNFQQQIIPQIAERFAGMGSGAGAGSSSALNQTLAQAGTNLQTQLAGLRGNLQMQALPQAFQYAQGPLQNILQAAGLIPGQYYENPGQEGFLQGVGKSFAQGFGSSFGGGNMFNFGGGGGGYQPQYPLSNYYDQQFRMQGF